MRQKSRHSSRVQSHICLQFPVRGIYTTTTVGIHTMSPADNDKLLIRHCYFCCGHLIMNSGYANPRTLLPEPPDIASYSHPSLECILNAICSHRPGHNPRLDVMKLNELQHFPHCLPGRIRATLDPDVVLHHRLHGHGYCFQTYGEDVYGAAAGYLR